MFCVGKKFASAAVALLGAMALSGCVSIQAIEPVISPPSVYQLDTSVKVEFVHPAKIGFRCAERGAKFIGLPGINSGACADETLVTMPNPCATLTGGWYAKVLCHELAHANGWPHDHEDGTLTNQAPLLSASLSPEAQAAAARARQSEMASGDPALEVTMASADLAAGIGIVPVEGAALNDAVAAPVLRFAATPRGKRPVRVAAAASGPARASLALR